MTPQEVLKKYKTIAVVGFSDNRNKDSYKIAKYMQNQGYEVVGVNPALDEKEIDGIKCFGKLSNVPFAIEIVNLFRRSEYVYDVVKEAIDLNPKPKVIWAQIGIFSKEGKTLAEENNIDFIENKCLYIEHREQFKI